MANLRKRDEELLIWIEDFMFVIVNMHQDIFEDADAWLNFYGKYKDLWELNERLIIERKEMNATAKQKMREYRSNPDTREKAKAYAREYMKEYYRRKKQ